MNQKGVTMLKILYTVSICVIIVVVNIIVLNHYRAKQRDAVRIADMALIASGMQMLYTDQGTYSLGEACQTGKLLKASECSLLRNYVNLPIALEDPFPNNDFCSQTICADRVCEYSIGGINDDTYKIYFHLEKGVNDLSKGCHYLDQTGLH